MKNNLLFVKIVSCFSSFFNVEYIKNILIFYNYKVRYYMADIFLKGGNLPQFTTENAGEFCGASLIKCRFNFGKKDFPSPFTMIVYEDNGDAYSVWAPCHHFDRQLYPSWCSNVKIENVSNSNAPMLSFLDKSGYNICLLAISDVTLPMYISGGIDERTGKLKFQIELFIAVTSRMQEYEFTLYIDKRKIPFYDAVPAAREYWRSLGYNEAFVPEAARHRMLSTWYTFQNIIDENNVYEQCVLGREYGLDTVLLDAGWEFPNPYDNTKVDYSTMGNWVPCKEKFPDMRAFVDRIHALGMKIICWFATPFIGENADCFPFFEGKLIAKGGRSNYYMADPRFPEVRDWYIDKLTQLQRDYGFDGFKLDFVDTFRYSDISSTDYDKMDITDASKATEALMNNIHSALSAVNPDILIEYRQWYMGPAMHTSCNMMRVCDCAYGAMFNRVNSIDLRLMCGSIAIHSDMLMWDYEASVEAAADQLSNLLFCVPQISMLFDKLPSDHRKMLRFYLDFIDDNIEVLQHGKLVPLYPENLYPVIYSYKDGCVIAGLYGADSFTVPEGMTEAKIVCASGNKRVIVEMPDSFIGRNYSIVNCMGEAFASGSVDSELMVFNVPVNGIITIK